MRKNLAVHIFRRDLRTVDNSALNLARGSTAAVLPIFIFDPAQSPEPNSNETPHEYFSLPAFSFLLRSLAELSTDLADQDGRLAVFRGSPLDILRAIHLEQPISSVYFNRDYTPFAIARDERIKTFCAENGITCVSVGDALLVEPEDARKSDGTPYTVFTPFFKRNAAAGVRQAAALHAGTFYKQELKCEQRGLLESYSPKYSSASGGRSQALSILQRIETFNNYEKERDYPALGATTRLSAHNKFGTCSVREVYHTVAGRFGPNHPLLRELYWRDFFTHVAYNFPQVFGASFNQRYARLEWRNGSAEFDRWCRGETGYPIVDAGMRELNQSGFMHNRVRMITASFLTKDLLIDWRWGEKYFARRLVDYDPAVNNGNWQWAASTGCDAQPYFRIFNPWLQQKKFDADAEYIKRWVPELAGLPAAHIHKLHELDSVRGYSAPIVDHDIARIDAQEMFEACRQP